MAVYCISYDLKSDNYTPLIESIREYGIWWHQSHSTWFIETNFSVQQIIQNLNRHLGPNDKIIVIQVHKNWWAAGHQDEEYQWMRERHF